MTSIAFSGEAGDNGGKNEDALAIMERLAERLGSDPKLRTDVEIDLEQLRSAIQDLDARLAQSRIETAQAYARMASYTATILSRELKKVPASARVLAMTRQTGRTEEVERYAGRHDMLLSSIDRIAAQYAELVAALREMEVDLVRMGLDAYEQHLISEGFADQIQVHRVVIRHLEEYDASNDEQLEEWKDELQSL